MVFSGCFYAPWAVCPHVCCGREVTVPSQLQLAQDMREGDTWGLSSPKPHPLGTVFTPLLHHSLLSCCRDASGFCSSSEAAEEAVAMP